MNKKALNLPILISLVVGNMIGTGIYLLPASLAQYGTISILSWVYTSFGALFLALTFASLNKLFHKTGGPYAYVREAFGNSTGFIIAYVYWISNLVSIAGIAVASVGYLGFITPSLDANHASYSPLLALCFELAAVWAFTIINVMGIRTAGIVQIILTLIKISPLLLVAIIGLGSMHVANLTQFTVSDTGSFTAFSSAAALTFWAFIGLESATIPAESTTGSRAVYIATVFGTLISAVIYIFSTIVLMGMFSIVHLKSSQFPFAEAATILFGPYAALIVAVCAVVSGLGALNVCVLIQGQIAYAAARDHLFPKIFANLSKHNVPVIGQLLSSTLISLFLCLTMQPNLLEQFNNIILLAAFLTLLTYLMAMLASIKLQLQAQTLHSRKFNASMFVIASLATIYTIWMIASLDLKIILTGGLMILSCIPIYFLLIRKRIPVTA